MNSTVEIKIYGPGCKNCVKLHNNVINALSELDVEARVEKVEEISEIASAGIMSTPAFEIDGDIKVKGRVPGIKEIKDIIEAEL